LNEKRGILINFIIDSLIEENSIFSHSATSACTRRIGSSTTLTILFIAKVTQRRALTCISIECLNNSELSWIISRVKLMRAASWALGE
jgi:hypothetical protein